MGSFRRLVRRALAIFKLDAPILLYTSSGLTEYGWPESFYAQQAINREKEPIPWYTYPCIVFLESRLKPSFRVFEYGCGNSSLWYSSRVAEVISVEHDEGWADKILPRLPESAAILVIGLDNGYAEAVQQNGLFDVVVVDGPNRLECARAALSSLKADGIIVWDNADRAEFQEAKRFLGDKGFRSIEFEGMGPINLYRTQTAILYRTENCLGI